VTREHTKINRARKKKTAQSGKSVAEKKKGAGKGLTSVTTGTKGGRCKVDSCWRRGGGRPPDQGNEQRERKSPRGEKEKGTFSSNIGSVTMKLNMALERDDCETLKNEVQHKETMGEQRGDGKKR